MEHFKKYLTMIAVLVCMMLIGCDSCISCNFYFDDEEKPDVSTEIVTETIQTKRYGSEIRVRSDSLYRFRVCCG